VFWRRCVLVLGLGVLSCVLSPGAGAQTPTSCLNITTWWPDWPMLPGWFFYSSYPGTFVFAIASWKSTCPPPAAASETRPMCPTKAAAGRPICLSTGNTYIEQSDVRIPGLSGGLTLERTWNSQWPSTQSLFQVGMFGPNWRSTYEERVFVGSDNYIKYARGDGSFWSFGSTGGSWSLAAPQSVAVTLANGATYWTMTFQNGEQRLFNNTSGSLIAIIDRNGNATQLSYDGLNRLVTVTDPASRHLYFSYASPSSYLVTGITSDVGISLTYAYDGQNRLSQVTNPDLTTVTFAYDSHSLITAVTDSSGKILESHTYDSNGRGLTSSRALGVEALMVSYPTQ
jgi:YD repeat-containing protein